MCAWVQAEHTASLALPGGVYEVPATQAQCFGWGLSGLCGSKPSSTRPQQLPCNSWSAIASLAGWQLAKVFARRKHQLIGQSRVHIDTCECLSNPVTICSSYMG